MSVGVGWPLGWLATAEPRLAPRHARQTHLPRSPTPTLLIATRDGAPRCLRLSLTSLTRPICLHSALPHSRPPLTLPRTTPNTTHATAYGHSFAHKTFHRGRPFSRLDLHISAMLIRPPQSSSQWPTLLPWRALASTSHHRDSRDAGCPHRTPAHPSWQGRAQSQATCQDSTARDAGSKQLAAPPCVGHARWQAGCEVSPALQGARCVPWIPSRRTPAHDLPS